MNNNFITITNEEYHNHKNISSTNLKTLLNNPHLFYVKKYLGQDTKPTQAMILGSLIHNFLEHGELKDIYVLPCTSLGEMKLEGNGLNKKLFEEFKESKYYNLEEWNEQLVDEKGKDKYLFSHKILTNINDNCISLKDAFLLEELIKGLKGYSFYKDVFDNGSVIKEKAIFFKYDDLDLKAKIDALAINDLDKEIIIYDYKTISDISQKGINENMRLYCYNLQAYFYMLAVKSIKEYEDYDISFKFIFQSKTEPTNCKMLTIYDNQALNKDFGILSLHLEGKILFEEGIQLYKKYYTTYGLDKVWFNEIPEIKINNNNENIIYNFNKIINEKYSFANIMYNNEACLVNKDDENLM